MVSSLLAACYGRCSSSFCCSLLFLLLCRGCTHWLQFLSSHSYLLLVSPFHPCSGSSYPSTCPPLTFLCSCSDLFCPAVLPAWLFIPSSYHPFLHIFPRAYCGLLWPVLADRSVLLSIELAETCCVWHWQSLTLFCPGHSSSPLPIMPNEDAQLTVVKHFFLMEIVIQESSNSFISQSKTEWTSSLSEGNLMLPYINFSLWSDFYIYWLQYLNCWLFLHMASVCTGRAWRYPGVGHEAV